MGEYVAEQHETREKAKLTGTPCMRLEIVLHVVTEIEGDGPAAVRQGYHKRSRSPINFVQRDPESARSDPANDLRYVRDKQRLESLHVGRALKGTFWNHGKLAPAPIEKIEVAHLGHTRVEAPGELRID